MTRDLRTPIYELQPRETARPFQAFVLYRDMGPERSIAKVARRLSKSIALLSRWSRTWAWVARSRAWDAWRDTDRLAAVQKADREKAEQWANRRELVRDRQWDLALQALGKVDAMLKFPVAVETEVSEDGAIIVTRAPKFGWGAVTSLSQMAVDMMLAAVGGEVADLETARRQLEEMADREGLPDDEVEKAMEQVRAVLEQAEKAD